MTRPSRRQLFAAAGAAVAGLSTARGADRKPALRVAHVTDAHVSNDRDAPAGMAALFAHVFGRTDWTPEFVLNSGDAVLAIDGKTTGAKAAEQIGVWQAAVKACPVPIHSALGNHDVWAGTEPTDAAQAKKTGFGLMVEALGMPAPYYSFDRGGWHFVVLNSVCEWPKYGALSPEHFAWLKADLKKTPKATPVLVVSHLPIVSVTSSLYGPSQRQEAGVLVPKAWQHADCWAISELFRRHGNVRLCLSGHMHTCDRCEYRGVWYVCGGAASGAWWAGSEYGFPPCYGKLDLFADGTFIYDFVDYGWKARGWKGAELKDS